MAEPNRGRRRRNRDDEDTPGDDDKQERPVKVALDRLVAAGTLTEEQARAVKEAVRAERQARRG
jgi:hypothetical protein